MNADGDDDDDTDNEDPSIRRHLSMKTCIVRFRSSAYGDLVYDTYLGVCLF